MERLNVCLYLLYSFLNIMHYMDNWWNKGEIKVMGKVISVRKLMDIAYLPRPKYNPKYLDNGDELLPVITVECEE